MANDLGIRVKVNFPDAAELKSDLESKIGKDGMKIKVKLDADDSIATLKSSISSAFDKETYKIKVDISDKHILKDLVKLERDFQGAQARMANSAARNATKGFEQTDGVINNVTKNGRSVTKSVFEANNKMRELESGVYRAGTAMSKITKSQDESFKSLNGGVYRAGDLMSDAAKKQEKVTDEIERSTKAYKDMSKASTELSTSEKRSMASATDKKDRLKEISGIMKEINSLEVKGVGSDDKTKAVIDKRIESLKDLKQLLQSDFLKKTGVDSNDSAIVKETENIGKYNIALKEISVEKAKQKADMAKEESMVSELLSMENKRYRLIKQASTAGEKEGSELRKQASDLEKQAAKYKEINNLQNASVGSLKKLSSAQEENSRMLERANAKSVDKKSNGHYKEMKSDLKEIYSIRSKINDLEINKKHGLGGGKEDIQLKGLKEQYELLNKSMEAKRKMAKENNELNSSDSKRLDNLKQEYAANEKIANIRKTSNAKAKAYEAEEKARAKASVSAERDKARISKEAYSQLEGQLKKISGLNEKMSSAGRYEAQNIRDIVREEESRYAVMKKQADLQGKITREQKSGLANLERESAVSKKNNEHIQRGSQLDKDLSSYSLQQMFNPRTVMSNARQVFQVIHESIGRVDAELVNIAKVADVPDDVMAAFSENVYGYATEFGVSADKYAEAVGRWITTGKTLSESTELANASVMGSFVGNIDEAAMVDYMAIPLNAWKSEMLEANDIINAMNEVSNNNAIEMDDLGAAYERAAATSSQAGTSFSQLTGMVTAAQEATRAGGEKIGTAIKAMDVNFGKIGSKITKGDQDKFDFFKGIGVDITDGNDKLRSTYDIMNDLAGVWDKLDEKQKSTAGSYGAGKNHSSVFAGMMKEWESGKKAAREAQGQIDLIDKENGSAFKEFEAQKNSIEYATMGLKNAWDEFINSASGGKEVVISVMDSMANGLKKVTELSKNTAFRNFGKGMIKAGAIMTATTAASKFFSVISAGTLSSVNGLKNVMLMFQKTGREASKAQKMNKVMKTSAIAPPPVIQKSAPAPKRAKVETPIVAMGGAAKGISKSTGAMSKFLSVTGKIVPALSLIMVTMSILEALGLDVWGGLGKLAELTGEKFESAAKKSEKANKKFIEDQKEIKKELDKNLVTNGTTQKVQEGLESANELRESKIKAGKESGNNSYMYYNDEEFARLQKQLAADAEALGIDISLEYNDFDYVNSQLDLLAKKKQEIEKSGFKDQTKLLLKASKKEVDLEKAREASDKKAAALEKKLQDKKLLESESRHLMSDKRKKEVDKENAELQKQIDKQSNFYGTEEALKASKTEREKFSTLREGRSKNIEQFQNGVITKDNIGSAGSDGQKLILADLTSQGRLMTRNNKIQAESSKDLEKQIGVYAKGGQEIATVSKSTLDTIKGMNKEYQGLSSSLESWEEKGFSPQKIFEELQQHIKESNKATEEYKQNLRDLANDSGVDADTIEGMMAAMDNGAEAYVDFMLGMGQFGEDVLEIGLIFKDRFGENWKKTYTDIQSQIEQFSGEDLEKAIKLKLVTEDGLINGETLDGIAGLPEEITTRLNIINEDGGIDLENTLDLLAKVKELTSLDSELKLKLGVEGNEDVTLENIIQNWDSLSEKEQIELMMALGVKDLEETKSEINELTEEEKEVNVKVKAETEEADSKVEETKGKVEEVDGKEGKVTITAENSDAIEKSEAVERKNELLDGALAISQYNAENSDAVTKAEEAKNAVNEVDGKEAKITIKSDNTEGEETTEKATSWKGFIERLMPELKVKGEDSDAESKKDNVVGMEGIINKLAPVLTVTGNISAAMTALNTLRAEAAAGITASMTITKTIHQVTKKSTKTDSVGAGKSQSLSSQATNPNLGKSMSASVGKSQSQKSSGNPRYNKDKVDEDVWRYWAKELFKGLPLERSMENLNNSIKKAGENQGKIISLYKQQISLMDKQIAYNNEMKKAKQSEMNSVLSTLRKDGFRTKGNKITNLERSKSFKDEKASEVNEQLRKYKELYQSIDQLTGKINSLNVDKFDAKENIKKAEISKELKSIEKTLKKVDAKMTLIKNRSDIRERKDALISSDDVELKLTISEEGLNTSVDSARELINQFNALSKMNVKHGENAEQLKGKLDDLKTEILNNADAILEYREAMNGIRIDRLLGDFDKLSETMRGNIDNIETNISHLKDGLVDGTNFKDLISSNFDDFIIDRKSKMEKDVEERIKLEAELNEALDGYGTKNIDRTAKVANSVLSIEREKYAKLLKMQSDYTKGTISNYKVKTPEIAIGKKAVEKEDKQYNDWLNILKSTNGKYTNEMNKLQSQYEQSMAKSNSYKDKEIAKNNFIIEQMKLQEKMYKEIIKLNAMASDKAKLELKNPNLTTEQKEKLQDAIKDYKQDSIAAQQSIADTVRSRFEFEFDLLDTASKKLEEYTDVFERLLSVSRAANVKPEMLTGTLQSLYNGKVSEFNNARSELSKLMRDQSRFSEGSLEWKLLGERIDNVRSSVHELTMGMLEANKGILDNQLGIFDKASQKSMLDGKTLEQYRTDKDRWLKGVVREIELEKLRIKAVDLENDMINRKLQALDRQEKVSKKDLEYMDKQMKVLELQQKLSNMNKERSVQTITKKDDGSWGWEYVADMTDYDKTKDELLNAKKELEEFKESQREAYASELSSIINKAKEGGYESTYELQEDISSLRKAYESIIDEIPNANFENMSEMLSVYEDYLRKNNDIVQGAGGNARGNNPYRSMSVSIGDSLRGISVDAAQILSEELRTMLSSADSNIKEIEKNFIIQSQELSFPNVVDSEGIEEIFRTLPNTVRQATNAKW